MSDELDIAKNVSGAGKEVAELFNKVLSVWAEPTLTRRNAKAQAEAIATISQAEMASEEKKFAHRAILRMLETQLYRQENLEGILQITQTILQNEESLPAPLDVEWMHRFVDAAQYSNKTEVREMWARILSKEAMKPGSIGYRTINLLKDLSQNDAQLIQKALNYGVVDENGLHSYGFIVLHNGKLEESIELNYLEIRHLQDLGIIHEGDLGEEQKVGPGTHRIWNLREQVWKVTNHTEAELKIQIKLLTPVGLDLLLSIISDPVPKKVLTLFENYLRETQFTIEKVNNSLSL